MTRPRWVVTAFFGFILAVGLLVFRDYGVSWDETVDQLNGAVNAKYIGELIAPEYTQNQESYGKIPPLATFTERDHGPAFEYPAIILTKLLGADDSRPVYFLRHLFVFLVYYLGLVGFYGLLRRRYHDWRLALLGVFVLWMTPRMFAESFYNAKDSTFLGLFTLSMCALAFMLERPTWRWVLVHSLAAGAAVALRVTGVLLVPLTAAGVGLTLLTAPPALRRRLLLCFGGWLLVAYAAAILLWPWLWEAPWTNLKTAFLNLSRFQRWDGEVLYRGKLERALNLPWHYAFTWIGLTVPLSYLAAFGLGLLAWLLGALRRFRATWATPQGVLDLLAGAWFVGPLFAVVVLHSVLYDGWRHLYFIYPALLYFAIGGVAWLLRGWQQPTAAPLRWLAGGLLAVLGLGALEPVWRIVRDHPHQQVYFNNLITPAEVESDYERDYWALSFRQGLEWILAHDTDAQINVTAERPELIYNNALVLKPADRARIRQVHVLGEAKYFITNYRWHPAPYPNAQYGWEVYAVYSNGVKILSVHQRQ
jgi:Dolichyl-phosphate-mannose-protein mannosyltransferase